MASKIVFENANLFDGDHAPRGGSHVVVEDNRITAVGTGPAPAAGADRVIDLAGRALLPGMYIGHYHGGAGYGTPAYAAFTAAKIAKDTLMLGFTSAISAGCPGYIEPSLVQAIDEGMVEGPRILPGSRDVSGTGNNVDILAPWYQQVPGSIMDSRCCDGPEGFRLGIRDEVKHGARIIKLLITSGHGTLIPRGCREISSDELRVAIDTAHERGALIRGHTAGRDAILEAVEAGIDIIDHGDGLDDECIAAMVERGTFLAPTLGFPKTWLDGRATIPQAVYYQEDLDHMLNILPAANEAGVKLLVGDDYFGLFSPGDEIEVYAKDAKLPAVDIIRWATKHGAEAVGRGHELGTVEVGKLADLVVLDGDPIEDITVFKDRVVCVMKDGVFAKNQLA